MKLFKVKGWDLQVSEEAWGLSSFEAILKRDKDKEKQRAMKEMLFIYFFCDIKSDFISRPEKEREAVIRKELNLPEDWVVDEVIKAGIATYKANNQTVIQRLYQQSLKAAQDIGNYLENTDVLLAERDANDKVVTDIAKITSSLDKIPNLMSKLKAAYKEVVQEQEDLAGKKKGSQTMNLFEKGFGTKTN